MSYDPKDLAADLRSRINAEYAAFRGTESYERRLCAEAIEAQADDIDRLQRALDLKAAALRQAMADSERLRAFVLDLLDPEGFGHAVTAEVRDAARRALGMPARELSRPAVLVGSFNESSARRDALAWPRGSLGEDVAP
jgi:hypothetical protein